LVAVFSVPEDAIRAALVHPRVLVASDAIMVDGKGHPRASSTNARVLGHYVRDEKALPLMTALRKLTLMPAQRLQHRAPAFARKGRVQEGADADLTIFDPATIAERATWAAPTTPPAGIDYVLVGGTPVVERGQLRGDATPGKPLRAPRR
jgi:N-acyl-D-aspartate/D-glutamate deacylase